MSTESLISDATTLHESYKEALTLTDPELVKEAIIKRRRIVTDLNAHLRELRKMKKAIEIDAARRMAETQVEIDALTGIRAIQDDDIRELEDYKWTCIRAEKEAGKPHSTSPELQDGTTST